MLNISAVNHVGIRVGQKDRSIRFYEQLGFALRADAGFDAGHPVIMEHPSGVVLNLLGPADPQSDGNVLMDVAEKHPGITHVALTVESLDDTKRTLAELNVPITGSFSFGNLSAVFIRDPDRTVIELDAYTDDADDSAHGYEQHP